MFLKHIFCTIKPENRLAFSEAQRAWSKTRESEGFLIQIGGWNLSHPNEAVILSFWKNKSFLDDFMNNSHDDIFYQSNQLETYENIIISYFECDHLHADISTFINKIDLIESLITIHSNEDSSLKIEILNDTAYIKSQNLENKKIVLIKSWKII